MSKKSHRRQTKPAAVQSYLVSDALGDVLARALTAFDRADAYTLQRTLNGPQAGVELARLPNLRMFLESCVRLIDLSAQNGGRAPAHAAKKMRKALGLALSEGLPSAAFEVVTRRIAIIDKCYAAALRGLNELVAAFDRAEVSTGSPIFDKFLQRLAHETRFLAETGTQIATDDASPVFNHAHFVEDLPFGDESWHPRLIEATVRFNEALRVNFEDDWSDRVTNDGRFDNGLDQLNQHADSTARRTLGIILPHLRADAFADLPTQFRFEAFEGLFDLFADLTDLTPQIALTLGWLQKPEMIAAPPECPVEAVEDTAKLFIAAAFIHLLDPDSKRLPSPGLRPQLHASLQTPALDRWLALLQSEVMDETALQRLIEAETVPALRTLAEELSALRRTVIRMKSEETRSLKVLQAEADKIGTRLDEAEREDNLRAMPWLALLAETYAVGTELVDEDPDGAMRLLLAGKHLANRVPIRAAEDNPLVQEACAAAGFEIEVTCDLYDAEEWLGVDLDDLADDEDDDFDGGFDDEDTIFTLEDLPNEERILPAKYASEQVVATTRLLETDSPVHVIFRSRRDDAFIVFTENDLGQDPALMRDFVRMTANQLVNLRPDLIGLFQKPSVMQGGFVRRADGRGFERLSADKLPEGHPNRPRYAPFDEAFWDDAEDAVLITQTAHA